MIRSLFLIVSFAALTGNSVLLGAEGEEKVPEKVADKKVEKKVDPSGTWKWERSFNDNKRVFVLRLSMEEGKIVGTYTGRRDETKIEDATMEGDQLSFQFNREFEDRKFTAKFQGKVSEDTIKGTIAFSSDRGEREFEWEAERATELADVIGKWQFKIETPNGNVMEPSVTFSKDGDKIKGAYSSQYGDREATNIKIKDNNLTFQLSGENDENDFTVVYIGKPKGNSIKGKVEYDFNGNAGSVDFIGKLIREKKKENKESVDTSSEQSE